MDSDILPKGKFGKIGKGAAQIVEEEEKKNENEEDQKKNNEEDQKIINQGGFDKNIYAFDTIEVDIKKLKEEENQKKKEQILKFKLGGILNDELKFGKYNRLKVQEKWLKKLRKEKLEELKKEIEIIAQKHDRKVDRKDAIIQMLYRDLSESEEQYKISLRTYLNHLDELLELHHKNVQSLEEEFQRDLELLKKEFSGEREQILKDNENLSLQINEIIKEMKKRAENRDSKMKKQFLHDKEAIKNAYSDDENVMKMMMGTRIEQKKKMILKENEQHCKDMELQYKEFITKKNADDRTYREIKQQRSQIKTYKEKLSHWKAKWLNNLRESEERNKKLLEEKKSLNKHYTELKKKMEKFRQNGKDRLKNLVLMANDTKKVLQVKLEKIQRILKLSELSRKIETEREKILPFETATNEAETISTIEGQQFPYDNENENEMFPKTPDIITTTKDFSINNNTIINNNSGIAGSTQQLKKFYIKFNKVQLDVMALKQEKHHLIEENKKLRSMLKQYLDGISVNEDVLNQKNPLLICEGIEQPQQVLVKNYIKQQN